MLSTAKSTIVKFSHVVQKIPFINSEKKFLGVHNVHTNISVQWG